MSDAVIVAAKRTPIGKHFRGVVVNHATIVASGRWRFLVYGNGLHSKHGSQFIFEATHSTTALLVRLIINNAYLD